MIKRIAVFLEEFEPLHETKDMGQIVLGLIDAGVEAELITQNKNSLNNYSAPFPITGAKAADLTDENFWRNLKADVIVFYHGLRRFKKHFQAIKAANKKIIIKLDSHGRIWYPLHYLKCPYFRFSGNWLRRIGRIVKWSIPFWRRLIVNADFKQLEMADAIIIESPEALQNLIYLYNYWRRPKLITKTYFIPNPVESLFAIPISLFKKENTVISVGRWDFPEAKNPKLLIKVLVEFLRLKKDYKAKIIGSDNDRMSDLLKKYGKDISDRVEIFGHLKHDRLQEHLRAAKMFFMPSRWEGFGIAAAEAICSGCSIVGTPLESLKYLSMQGFSGETAVNFSKNAVLAGLLFDAEKWERGEYDSQEISRFWQQRLNRKKIAEEFIRIAQKL